MNIKVNNEVYKNFLSMSVTFGLDTISRGFEFKAATRGGDIPFAAGQAVEIFEDDELLLTGYIEKLKLKTDGEGNHYTITGRDKLGDLIDSNLPRVFGISSTLSGVIRFVLAFLGIDVKVKDQAGTDARPFTTVSGPDPDDTGFEFLASTARRKQCLLISDAESNVLIVNGEGRKVEQKLINRRQAPGVKDENNLLSAELLIDHTKRFGRYTTDFQIQVSAGNRRDLATDPRDIVDAGETFLDPDIRQSRFKTVGIDKNYDVTDHLKGAVWESDLAVAESIKYNVTVPGFRDYRGVLWKINTAPVVIDEFSGIDGPMLIRSLTFTEDKRGKTTSIRMTDPEAFSVQLQIRKATDLDAKHQT